MMPAIEAPGVGAQQPLHAQDEIGLGRLGDEVKMIAHETPGMELPPGLLAGFTKGGEEGAPILIVAKDRLAPVAAIHEVVDGPRILNAQWPRHGGKCMLRLATVTPQQIASPPST